MEAGGAGPWKTGVGDGIVPGFQRLLGSSQTRSQQSTSATSDRSLSGETIEVKDAVQRRGIGAGEVHVLNTGIAEGAGADGEIEICILLHRHQEAIRSRIGNRCATHEHIKL
jgi:hypothetical protein